MLFILSSYFDSKHVFFSLKQRIVQVSMQIGCATLVTVIGLQKVFYYFICKIQLHDKKFLT